MSQFVEYTDPQWRGLNMRNLKTDEAFLQAISHHRAPIHLYSLSEECYTCPYSKVKTIHHQVSEAVDVLQINVAHPTSFRLYDRDVGQYAFDNQSSLCFWKSMKLQEFGVYNLTIYANGTCKWITDKPGVNIYLSLVAICLLMALLTILVKGVKWAWSRYIYIDVFNNERSCESSTTTINTLINAKQIRMRSLDAFRGLSIAMMIFVNSGGGGYWWIEHATWNGLHLADIVFPSFLWIMGVCMPLSIQSQLRKGISKCRIYLAILKRSIKLFLIGLCLNSINGPNLADLRIMGVLQRFAVAYLICGIVYTISTQYQEDITPQSNWKRSIHDLIILKVELLVMLLLTVIYLSITFAMKVPACPNGYLGPGGKHAYAAYSNCTGGAAGYIDLKILHVSHVYQHSRARVVYDAKPFDPEGVFGCLLTAVQVFIGCIAGVIMLVHAEWKARIIRYGIWSVILAILAGALCGFSQENGLIPINKNLWSLSFVCLTTALAFALLSLLYYVIDVKQWWDGHTFQAAGKNAIIMYVGHTVMHKMLPWHWRIGAMNTHFMLMLEALWNTMLWLLIGLYLDLKGFYYSL